MQDAHSGVEGIVVRIGRVVGAEQLEVRCNEVIGVSSIEVDVQVDRLPTSQSRVVFHRELL